MIEDKTIQDIEYDDDDDLFITDIRDIVEDIIEFSDTESDECIVMSKTFYGLLIECLDNNDEVIFRKVLAKNDSLRLVEFLISD